MKLDIHCDTSWLTHEFLMEGCWRMNPIQYTKGVPHTFKDAVCQTCGMRE